MTQDYGAMDYTVRSQYGADSVVNGPPSADVDSPDKLFSNRASTVLNFPIQQQPSATQPPGALNAGPVG